MLITTSFFQAMDTRLLSYFSHTREAAPDWLATIFVWFQNFTSVVWGVVTAVLILFWLATRHTRRFLLMLISVAGAELLWLALVFAIGRERPEPVAVFGGINLPSYPSGHALFNLAFYVTLTYIFYGEVRSTRGKRALLGVVSLLLVFTGLNRLFFSVHYFSDLLGGYLMGVAWTAFALWLADWLTVRWKGEIPEGDNT
ncbi:MAG: phosphatase PAP2 family protein [Anaerolineaceae bacterium]|nr:phosphatase PAP2 family protein [Anaerolineaceae bacterium]